MNTVHASQTNELELTSSDYVVFEVLQRTKFESQFSQDITFIGDRTSSSKSIDHRQFCEILRFMLKTTAQLLHSVSFSNVPRKIFLRSMSNVLIGYHWPINGSFTFHRHTLEA